MTGAIAPAAVGAGGAVLVTGATGAVGRFVVEALRARQVTVREAVTRIDPSGSSAQCRFAFEDSTTWSSALSGVDRVFLMRPPAISDVKGVILPFVDELARRSIASTVVLSVMGVNPAVPHWQLERGVKASGLPWTMLRPAFFMQNLETAYRVDIRDHDRIRLSAGNGKTSFIDTRDIADVAAAALTCPGAHASRAYTLTGGRALGWHAVASMLSAELGRPIGYEPISLLASRREMRAAGLPDAYVNVQLLISIVARVGLAASVSDEVSTLLGRPPRDLRSYIHETARTWA